MYALTIFFVQNDKCALQTPSGTIRYVGELLFVNHFYGAFWKWPDFVCLLYYLVYQLGKGLFTSLFSLTVNRVFSPVFVPILVFFNSHFSCPRFWYFRSWVSAFITSFSFCHVGLSESNFLNKNTKREKPGFLFEGYKRLSNLWVKRSGRKADHLQLPSAMVKNNCSSTTTPGI